MHTRFRRCVRKSLTIIVLSLLATPALWGFQDSEAQSGTDLSEPMSQELTGGEPLARLHQIWNDYLEAKALEDEGERQKQFDLLKNQSLKYSANIYEPASYLFLEEGLKDMDNGNLDEARNEFHNAIELNPHLWPAYEGLALIMKDKDRYSQFLSLDLKGMGSSFSLDNAFFLLDALQWLFENLLGAAILSYILVIFLLFLKYLRPLYETSVSSMEQRELSELYAGLISFLLIVFPFFLGANLLVTASIYLVLLYPFFSTGERRATLILTLLAISIPLQKQIISNLNALEADPNFKLQLGQYLPLDVDSRIDILGVQQGPLRDRSLISRAYLLRASGNEREALEQFEQLSLASPLRPLALVGIGNIHYNSKEYTQAIDSYNEAVKLESKMAIALYNLSLAHAQMGKNQQAERFRTQAASLSPSIRDRVTFGAPDANRVLDALPDHRQYFLSKITHGFVKIIEDVKLPEVLIPLILFIAVFFAALIHASQRSYSLLARTCIKCGRVYFQSDSPKENWCSQCVNLYVRKADMPSAAKARKYEEVKRFNKRKRLIYTVLQILIPGAKKIIKGQTFAGLITVFLWVILVITVISPVTEIANPSMLYLRGMPLISLLMLAVTVVFWGLFGLRPIWQED